MSKNSRDFDAELSAITKELEGKGVLVVQPIAIDTWANQIEKIQMKWVASNSSNKESGSANT